MLFTAGSPPFAYKSVRITSLVVVNNFQSQLCKRFNCCPNVALLFATHATRCSNRRKTDQLKSRSLWRCCTAVQWEAIFTTKRRGRSADRSRVAVRSTEHSNTHGNSEARANRRVQKRILCSLHSPPGTVGTGPLS